MTQLDSFSMRGQLAARQTAMRRERSVQILAAAVALISLVGALVRDLAEGMRGARNGG